VVINKGLIGYDQRARKRFTLAHENSHWILHRSYHSPTNQKFQLRTQMPGYVACRSSQVESSHHMLRTDKDWEEWQADSLAAALLMPKKPFIQAARDELGIGLSVYRGKMNSCQYYESLARIANQFQVSKNAACIRLKQLGLIPSVV
ncbi:MAG: ImmA/IrrE family metallo-endopeptidase, partial [Eubacteriales bacterium]|nr:ImmA/IrrE family metallo-endopeptidase [Eubacteriales bacterium]